ncbi:hypothetical protein [Plastoroseomonas hellenica]|uniref:hypothetical protein n=1 Tax=Plastoroseomonas hellenica TaxID=2687306 RepID=UPI001BA5901E|nr:hypothetical protein [Plastoroseomonas hellenica]MBR0643668.1 hypothetical protein [Plastoroseomonas hellenica]
MLALIHERFGDLRKPFSPDARINGPGGFDDEDAEYLIVDAFRLLGLPDRELPRFPYARFFASDAEGGVPLSAILARVIAFAFDPWASAARSRDAIPCVSGGCSPGSVKGWAAK